MGTLINKKIKSLNRAPRQGQGDLGGKSRSGSPTPVKGYERALHINRDGIVEQGGGVIYYTNSRDELMPVVMTDSTDVIHNVIKSYPANQSITKYGSSGTRGGTGTNDYGEPYIPL